MNEIEMGMAEAGTRSLRDDELQAVNGGQIADCPPSSPQPNDAAMSVWNRLLYRYGFPSDSCAL